MKAKEIIFEVKIGFGQPSSTIWMLGLLWVKHMQRDVFEYCPLCLS
jgi:hypothetical protein